MNDKLSLDDFKNWLIAQDNEINKAILQAVREARKIKTKPLYEPLEILDQRKEKIESHLAALNTFIAEQSKDCAL